MSQWIRGGQVYDVHRRRYRRADSEVRDGRIAALTDGVKAAADDHVLDVDGAFLLPGLIDCHVHMCSPSKNSDRRNTWRGALPGTIAIHAAQSARRTLLGGTTTVRDVGGWDYHEIAVRNAINAGLIEGPRMFCAGRLLSITTATAQYFRGMYEVADGPDEVRRMARKQLAHGADLIKVMATGAMISSEYEDARAIQYTLDELKAAVAVAEANHTHVAAHAHALDGIRNAALAGCRSVEHGSFDDAETYALMAARGTYLVPTCCVTSALLADNEANAGTPRAHSQPPRRIRRNPPAETWRWPRIVVSPSPWGPMPARPATTTATTRKSSSAWSGASA